MARKNASTSARTAKLSASSPSPARSPNSTATATTFSPCDGSTAWSDSPPAGAATAAGRHSAASSTSSAAATGTAASTTRRAGLLIGVPTSTGGCAASSTWAVSSRRSRVIRGAFWTDIRSRAIRYSNAAVKRVPHGMVTIWLLLPRNFTRFVRSS